MSQTLNSRWLICRICLKSEHKKLYNIFEPIVEEEISDLGTTLVDKIELCGAIKLQRQQNLPNQICNRCVLLLRAAYKFRDLCQQSQSQLKQFFTTIRQKVEQEDEEEENNRNNSGVVNFESDNDEQKQEDQDENNVILSEADYVVEESITDYDSSEENIGSINAKAEDYMQAIDDEDTEFPGFSDEEERQYVVEEVDAKQFVSEDNEDDITTYKYEEDIDSNNIILEEQPRKTSNQMYFKRISGKKLPASKRKRKNSQGESFHGIYNCTLCDNSYTDKTKYNNHIKIHAKEKPHECEICKKRFSTTPQLSRHMNSHTGNRPYKCKYCEARFGDPSTKIKHERIHTNERPYKCNLCLKAFAYSNVLKVHMMTHTGEKPHMCEYCGKTFSQQHHKNAHEKRHTSANMVMINNSSPDIEYMEEDELKEYKIEEII